MPTETETTTPKLGYDEIQNELVDSKDDGLLDELKTKLAIDSAGLGTIQKLSKEDLAKFMYPDVFSGEKPKTYSQMKNLPFLNFSLRAAMQHIGREDTEKYNVKGEKDANGKTIDEYLKDWGGLTNEYNKDLIVFLQKIVGAHPDGLAGPQTVWKVLDKLGYDVRNSAEGVNDLYKNNDKFKVIDIGKYSSGDTEYRYDQSKIKNGTGEGTYDIKFDSAGNLTTPGLKVENGWIVLDSNNSVDVISKFNLNKTTEPTNRDHYGIPSNVDVYKRNGYGGFCFFEGNNLIYIPDFLSIASNNKIGGPFVQSYDIATGTWVKKYPNNSENFIKYMIDSFKTSLQKNKISFNDIKAISYKSNKYYLKSFDQETVIDLKTFTDGWIVKGTNKDALGQNLQLLNLVNFIKSIKAKENKISSSSKFKRKGTNLVIEGGVGYTGDYDILTAGAGRDKYSFLFKEGSARRKMFVDYLNDTIIPKK